MAHEALIRDWQRLRDWLESNREIKRWRTRIEADISDWHKSGGSLLRDGRLKEAQAILVRYSSSLLIGKDEHRFITASVDHKESEYKKVKHQQLEMEVALQDAQEQKKIALVEKLVKLSLLAANAPSTAHGGIVQGLLLGSEALSINKNSRTAQSALWNAIQSAKHLNKIWYKKTIKPKSIGFQKNDDNLIVDAEDNLRMFNILTGEFSRPINQYAKVSIYYDRNGICDHINKGWMEGTPPVWNTITSQSVCVTNAAHEIGYAYITVLSPDYQYIAVGSDYYLRIWDINTKNSIGKYNAREVRAVAFSPNSNHIVFNCDNTLRLLDIKNKSFIGDSWQGHQDKIEAVGFSPDGKLVISGGRDKTLCLWDVNIGKIIGKPWSGHCATISCVAFNSTGTQIASADNDGNILLWNMDENHILSKKHYGYNGYIESIALNENDNSLVIDGNNGLLLLNMTSGKNIEDQWIKKLDTHEISYTSRYSTVVFSPSGKYIINKNKNHEWMLWDAHKKILICKLFEEDNEVEAVAFSPDEKYIISGSRILNLLHLWDIKSLKHIRHLDGGHKNTIFGGIVAIAFSPDSNFILSGSRDGSLQLWHVTTGSIQGSPWCEHSSSISTLAFSPSGKSVVSGSSDKTLRLWDVETGKSTGTPWVGHNDTITTVAFSPDGKTVISGSEDKTLHLWDIATGEIIGEPWFGHETSINKVIFSPDGKSIFSSGSWDETIFIWDADPESWAKKACSIVNRNFSLAEWKRFIGDALPYEKTCPDLPAPGEEGWVEPYAGG